MRAGMVAVAVCAGALAGCVGGGPESPSMPWVLTSAEGRVLHIAYVIGDGSCTVFDRIQVDQDARTVRIRVIGHYNGDRECPGVLMTGTGSVVLDRPLGGRRLTHAPVDRQWSRYAGDLGS